MLKRSYFRALKRINLAEVWTHLIYENDLSIGRELERLKKTNRVSFKEIQEIEALTYNLVMAIPKPTMKQFKFKEEDMSKKILK